MSLLPNDVDFLRSAIAERSGNVISRSQSYLLESRLSPVATEAGLRDVHALVAELKNNPRNPLHNAVTEAMTINETSFFRDMQPFDALRDHVVPEFLGLRKISRRLSIWSAACSSGQEPYSIAMLLRTHFPQLATWGVKLLSTDYSTEMVERTKAGLYSQFEVNRGLPSACIVRHFTRTGLRWQVKPDLRQLIVAKKLNLTEEWPLNTKHDVVFLRNVLIYFDRTTKEQILKRVHQSMCKDGYLFLGGGETLIQLDAPFEHMTIGKTVCYRPVAE